MQPFSRYSILPAVFVFLSSTCLSQSVKINIPQERIRSVEQKLDRLIASAKAGNVRIYPLCKITAHASYQVKEGTITFSENAIKLKGSSRSSFINMNAISDMAHVFYDKQNYDSASWYWYRALDTAMANEFDCEELHGIRMALNNNCFLLGDYTGAMRISSAGLARSEQLGDENRMAHFNNVIGYIYMKLGDTAKSGIYFQHHLENARSMNDTFEVAHALYNLGDLAITKKKYDEAISYFEWSLREYLGMYNHGFFNPVERKAYVFNKLAQCWKLKGDLPKAMESIHVSLVADTAKGVNEYDKADYFINAADIYNRLNRPDSALAFLKKGLAITIHINHRELKRDAFRQMAISFSQKKEFDSAYIYQNRYSLLKDSIDNEISREEIYQRDADRLVEQQKQSQKITLQRQRFWRNIIIGVSLLTIITVIFLYNRYRLKQKNRYQKELNRQQIELFNAIAATQDQERKRIAQDIHDSLGSVLSAAKLKLAEAKELKPELATDEKFLTGINLIDEASAELRSISHNIMPATLSKLGLVPALKNLSEKISSNKGLKVTFIAHDLDTRLDEQTEISIYRIILELINNIVKHAEAETATVQLVKFPDSINITVEDNGKGFDLNRTLQEKKGIGLGNIFSRVEYMKGQINVDAVPGRGTTVIIDIPVENS